MGTFPKADKHKRTSKRGKIRKMPCEHGNQDRREVRWLAPTLYFPGGMANTPL